MYKKLFFKKPKCTLHKIINNTRIAGLGYKPRDFVFLQLPFPWPG